VITGKESVPKIITNNTTNLFFIPLIAFWKFQTIKVSECCLIKLLSYILFEKMFIFQHWKWPAQKTSTVPTVSAHLRSLYTYGIWGMKRCTYRSYWKALKKYKLYQIYTSQFFLFHRDIRSIGPGLSHIRGFRSVAKVSATSFVAKVSATSFTNSCN